ncbi:MAG: acylneuraminate cytidylyltransferase family protein [Euryarchaeota archaeon]|nr:acylneuraminate cytidylyltransferase family protein [Euryarchaeota archaeon]
MYKDHVVVCVIPARGGSKGLPGKNIKMFCGKPLIAHTIEQARQSKYIDRVIVSTEDEIIAQISLKYGAEVPFIRPMELAGDSSSTVDVLLHAINWLEDKEQYFFDILVLLHATTPMRNVEDIDNCISLLVEENADNVFSVAEAHRNPYFNMVEEGSDGFVRLVKEGCFSTRQAAPKVYDMNASIYVWWKNVLKEGKEIFTKKTKAYVMPKKRSIDIDDDLDFRIAEYLQMNG